MMTTDLLQDELSAWCASYVAAFSVFDVEGIADHWTFPASVMMDKGLHSFSDRAAFIGDIGLQCDFYARKGVVSAERRLLSAFSLTENVASIRVKDHMLSVVGREIVRWEAAYTLARFDGQWRVLFAVAEGEMRAWRALS